MRRNRDDQRSVSPTPSLGEESLGNRSTSTSYRTKIVRIICRSIGVKAEPAKFSAVVCQLIEGVFVVIKEEKIVEGVLWLQIGCGWMSAHDNAGQISYIEALAQEAHKAWGLEFSNRKRISSSIVSMLTKSHSLVNARRVTRNILKHVLDPTPKGLLNLPDVSIEDLVIGLTSSIGLRQGEIFQFIKIASAQQSNPIQAMIDICEDANSMMNMRPSIWVKKDLGVLITADIKTTNDKFIMAAAYGDLKLFENFLDKGQELAVLHSELGYTCLHAAADFGAKEVLKRIIRTGLSINMKDVRKGQTALHFAAQSGRIDVATILLENNADRTIKCFKGMMPFQLADDMGYSECREVLKLPSPIIPEITITQVTTRSISLSWVPPIIHHDVHSKTIEYMLEWTPIGKSSDVGFGQQFIIPNLMFTVTDLLPSTGHEFCVRSRSLAGWSQPTVKIVGFTTSCPPDAPPPVEVLKITTNGIVLGWNNPLRDNGAPVDLFQLEVIDSETALNHIKDEEERGVNNISPRSWGQNESTVSNGGNINSLLDDDQNSVITQDQLPPEGSQEDDFVGDSTGSLLHRIIKHKNLNIRTKQMMGLEPHRPYIARVRCRNSFGYSHWSEWCGPIIPQPGVYVLKYNQEECSVIIGWFKPMLKGFRKLTGYQAQICALAGPITKNIKVYQARSQRKEEDSTMEFETLSDSLTTNELLVEDLRPGSKYMFRVRPQIDGVWCEWDLAVVSDVISVPATLPDPIFDIIPAPIYEIIPDEISSSQLTGEDSKVDDSEAVSTPKKNVVKKLDVSHNYIVITWTNGSTNGLPAVEYQVECVKIRDYRPLDVEMALEAANRTPDKSGALKPRKVTTTNNEGFEPEGKEFVKEDVENILKWKDITSEGDFLGPNAFRACNLFPGSCYIFRVRQRNPIGWSLYSKASHLITTFSAVPPDQPKILSVAPNHVIAIWKETVDPKLGLTNMEMDVQIGMLPLVHKNETEPGVYMVDQPEETAMERDQRINSYVEWKKANIREWDDAVASGIDFPGLPQPELKPGESKGTVCVMIDGLSSGTVYVIRVRVRTVAGWSTWSQTSNEFKTRN